jgi:hypothetical protein
VHSCVNGRVGCNGPGHEACRNCDLENYMLVSRYGGGPRKTIFTKRFPVTNMCKMSRTNRGVLEPICCECVVMIAAGNGRVRPKGVNGDMGISYSEKRGCCSLYCSLCDVVEHYQRINIVVF